jgi:hypothetical protein
MRPIVKNAGKAARFALCEKKGEMSRPGIIFNPCQNYRVPVSGTPDRINPLQKTLSPVVRHDP